MPLWASAGAESATGRFREALTWEGEPYEPYCRARVQARQAFVFATAAADGVASDGLKVARRGLHLFLSTARRPDGLYSSRFGIDGRPLDPTPRLYEHAFLLLALAAMRRADPGGDAEPEAVALRDRLVVFRHTAGGFREAGDEPFQANAQMHLFEAALAWEALGDSGWAALADELAHLAQARFLDPKTGALHELFDAHWTPLSGEAGLIEPGHQFEWAWLLERWGAARGDIAARAAARHLFQVGRRGFQADRCTIANALTEDLQVRDAAARLWPQTEHLKAALIMGEQAAALEAATGLATYLDTPVRGVWRERMKADGTFVEEPSPATSLYHLFLAVRELARGPQRKNGKPAEHDAGAGFSRQKRTGSRSSC